MRMIGRESGGWVRGLLRVLGLTFGIVAIAVWFAARTRGAADLLESWLTRRTGLDLSIGSMRVAWPYDLVITGIAPVSSSSVAADPLPGKRATAVDSVSFSAGSMRVGWRPRGWLIRLDDVAVGVRNDEEGQWHPPVLAPLGELLGAPIGTVSRLTETFRQRVQLRVSNGTIAWRDARHQELAVVEGVTFLMAPVLTPRAAMTYYELSIARVSSLGTAPAGREAQWIWLASEHSDYIELENPDRPAFGFGR